VSGGVKLAVDEWGAWHKQDPDVPPGYLYAYAGTLRDALISAINLDIFQRHTDKVTMANPAQMVNTIHSLFYTYEDKFILTPNYHIFEDVHAAFGRNRRQDRIRRTESDFHAIGCTTKGSSSESLGFEWLSFAQRQAIDSDVVNPHAKENA
jgi:alpha-N-arabinofuranosidase